MKHRCIKLVITTLFFVCVIAMAGPVSGAWGADLAAIVQQKCIQGCAAHQWEVPAHEPVCVSSCIQTVMDALGTTSQAA